MPIPSTAIELALLAEKSELVERQRLLPYLEQLQDPNTKIKTPRDCALAMVKEELITLFQAKLLLQGKWKNFFIGGKYKVLEHLGSGGMGTVYLCEHRYMRRRVAIKLLPPDKGANGTSLERFRREARAAAKLDHPNIVQAHDIDQDGQIHFLVMEYIDGISLQHLVESHGPLSIARAVNYMIQTADGLQHANRMNLVHRDIKPNNLLLDRQGIVKILDLGLARFEEADDGLTKKFDSKTVLGTADYLAPEQALCSQVDIRADIYSLGCVGYFMLAGRPVFDGGNVAQKLVKHQTMTPTPLNQLRPAVPVALSEILVKMLKKNKDERYSTPGEVIQALKPWFQRVEPPTAEEMPLHRFSHHRDIQTMSKVSSTMATMQSGVTRALNASLEMANVTSHDS